jgi:hypothetical protein
MERFLIACGGLIPAAIGLPMPWANPFRTSRHTQIVEASLCAPYAADMVAGQPGTYGPHRKVEPRLAVTSDQWAEPRRALAARLSGQRWSAGPHGRDER